METRPSIWIAALFRRFFQRMNEAEVSRFLPIKAAEKRRSPKKGPIGIVALT
jgi:hypothetical protein